MTWLCARRFIVFAVLVGSVSPSSGWCQPPLARAKTPPKPPSTKVEVELLTAADSAALHAQDWRAVFEQLAIPVTIRRPLLNDKPEVKERTVGTLRYVTVIATLDRQGRIVAGKRVFSRSDAPKVKEWIDELTTYGSQGAPTGQPLWGLNKLQFETLYSALSEKNDVELQGLSCGDITSAMKLPASSPARWSTEATEMLQRLGSANTVRQRVAGFTQATALAIALNDRGFGFRPNRTPAGSLELVIEPGSRTPADHWPIGWPVQRPLEEAAPKLFVMTNIEIQQESLADVIAVVNDLTDAPIILNYAELDRRKIDLAALRVNFPLRKTTWSIALRNMLVSQKLGRDYWQDEAGRTFIYVTPQGVMR